MARMEEPNLPFVDPKVEQIKPYPKGQVGFTRRAILGEWLKFSMQLNVQDEVVRKNLTGLCFELISKIEYSYTDYEHLLKRRTQLLSNEADAASSGAAISAVIAACANDHQDGASDIEDIINAQSSPNKNMRHSALDLKQEEENQSVEITIRTFENIGVARSLQDYCKPFTVETLTLDFDDVC